MGARGLSFFFASSMPSAFKSVKGVYLFCVQAAVQFAEQQGCSAYQCYASPCRVLFLESDFGNVMSLLTLCLSRDLRKVAYITNFAAGEIRDQNGAAKPHPGLALHMAGWPPLSCHAANDVLRSRLHEVEAAYAGVFGDIQLRWAPLRQLSVFAANGFSAITHVLYTKKVALASADKSDDGEDEISLATRYRWLLLELCYILGFLGQEQDVTVTVRRADGDDASELLCLWIHKSAIVRFEEKFWPLPPW